MHKYDVIKINNFVNFNTLQKFNFLNILFLGGLVPVSGDTD